MSERLMWTFRIVGGDPFDLQVLGNPSAEHGGGLSIWHLRVTDPHALEIEEVAKLHGARVMAHCQTETDEQTAMHKKMLESGDSLFSCLLCAECYWLDLQVEGYCGMTEWPPERRQAALESFEGAVEDAAACPVPR